MAEISKESLALLLAAITGRVRNFPRDAIHQKLIAADAAYHLSDQGSNFTSSAAGTDVETTNTKTYSRFQELQNALVREVCETYSGEYISTFLSKTQIFAMTSSNDKKEDAQKFNVLFSDQAKRTGWAANLFKVLSDVAKYNLCAVETSWTRVPYYNLGRVQNQAAFKVERQKQIWAGNSIKRLDMYNTFFDTAVAPELVSTEGEWAGYVEILTQPQLKKLIDSLAADDGTTVYTADILNPDNKNYNIYTSTRTNTTRNTDGSNMDYFFPPVVNHAAKDSYVAPEGQTHWGRHFGIPQAKTSDKAFEMYYEIGKFYLRIVPSSYGIGDQSSVLNEDILTIEMHILNQKHILAVKLLDAVHDQLPIDIGITDSDSTKHNAAGPAQITIPYAKLAKQMTDRVLAGADRAIADRAIFNPKYLDKDLVNSKYPDAKIPTKSLPLNKSIADAYYSIPYDNNATARLYQDKELTETAGRTAAGLNKAQQGQFVKGNKTLYEFDQIMQNADSRPFNRALFLESTIFTNIKTKLKMNILQYQEEAKLTDPETKEQITIKPIELFDAAVEFKVIDGLLPSEYVMSPNVQQALFTYFSQLPEQFAQKYDIMEIIAHVLEQSNGINMSQYKLSGGPNPGS